MCDIKVSTSKKIAHVLFRMLLQQEKLKAKKANGTAKHKIVSLVTWLYLFRIAHSEHRGQTIFDFFVYHGNGTAINNLNVWRVINRFKASCRWWLLFHSVSGRQKIVQKLIFDKSIYACIQLVESKSGTKHFMVRFSFVRTWKMDSRIYIGIIST